MRESKSETYIPESRSTFQRNPATQRSQTKAGSVFYQSIAVAAGLRTFSSAWAAQSAPSVAVSTSADCAVCAVKIYDCTRRSIRPSPGTTDPRSHDGTHLGYQSRWSSFAIR
jgi:hypothetical protein